MTANDRGRPGRRPHSVDDDTTTIPPGPDIGRPRPRPPAALCGCEWPPRAHDPGCPLEAPADLPTRLACDPFRAPRLHPDEECRLYPRIRADRDYAARLAAWITRTETG